MTPGGNAKYRSTDNVEARREMANAMNQRRSFSYTKWELPLSHPLLKEINAYMLRPEVRRQVAKSLGILEDNIASDHLSDLFVTNYAAGDFLSDHSDGVSGTYAFVASLATGGPWPEAFGGALQMFDRQQRRYWPQYHPTFNSLVLFATRKPPGPLHRVQRVTEHADQADAHRFGFTGWYADPTDVWSAQERAELDKVRGA